MGFAAVSDRLTTLRLDHSLSAVPEPAPPFFWAPQDPILQVVFLIGVGIIIFSFLMLLAVFLLRMRLMIREKRQRSYEGQWQPLLAQCLFAVPQTLPNVPRNMRYHFLRAWNFHHESLVGASQQNLEALAKEMNLQGIAREMMHTGSLREQLMAVMTLGHLRDRTQWHDLRALVASPSPMLSLLAARALLDIDAPATLAWLVTVMAARDDWPMSRVVSMLREVGPDAVTLPLISAAEAAIRAEGGEEQVSRLLRMMDTAHIERVSPVAVKIAREIRNPELIAAALRMIRDPRGLDIVRAHARHESWFVRASAIQVLGRIGDSSDVALLTKLLSDSHWWVRYRSARALLTLPDTPIARLEQIRNTLEDRFAADILGQAIAEARQI